MAEEIDLVAALFDEHLIDVHAVEVQVADHTRCS
jgi:hypothetical protein